MNFNEKFITINQWLEIHHKIICVIQISFNILKTLKKKNPNKSGSVFYVVITAKLTHFSLNNNLSHNYDAMMKRRLFSRAFNFEFFFVIVLCNLQIIQHFILSIVLGCEFEHGRHVVSFIFMRVVMT